MVRFRERIGVLCAQLSRWSSLADIVRDGGAGDALDELMAAVRGSAPQEPDQLVRLLDAVEEACARCGLAGVTNRGNRPSALPPGLSGSVVGRARPAWVCPCSCCERVVFAEEAATAPVCAMADRAMRPFQVLP